MLNKISASNLIKPAFWKSALRMFGGAGRHYFFGFKKQREVKFYHRLALGAIYSQLTKLTGTKSNKQAYQIGQAFIGYVLSLDPHLDNPNFGPRIRKELSLKEIKSIPVSKDKASEFVARIKLSSLSREQKKSIIKVFSLFRRDATKGVLRTFKDNFADYDEVILGVRETAGKMYGAWAKIVALAQGLDEKSADKLKDSFSRMSTGLQFVDDAFDCFIDFGAQQNILVSIAKGNDKEFSLLKKHSGEKKNLNFGWIRKNMPWTFVKFSAEFENIVSGIPDEHRKLKEFTRDAFYGW